MEEFDFLFNVTYLFELFECCFLIDFPCSLVTLIVINSLAVVFWDTFSLSITDISSFGKGSWSSTETEWSMPEKMKTIISNLVFFNGCNDWSYTSKWKNMNVIIVKAEIRNFQWKLINDFTHLIKTEFEML